jgi:hypothetical protein
MINQTESTVPADVLLDLSVALCPRGPVAEPKTVEEILERCPDAERRAELWEFIHRIDTLPPEERSAIVESVDDVQVRSKLWLIDELTRLRDLAGAELLVLGAWYGILPFLMNLRLERPPAKMLCVDINPHPGEVGAEVFGSMYPNIHYQCADAMDYDYEPWSRNPAALVMNTICEHLPDLPGWWHLLPPGQLVVMQSNNYRLCCDHVNCVDGVEDMKAQTPMSEVLYEGVLPLSLFDRFMVIGRR